MLHHTDDGVDGLLILLFVDEVLRGRGIDSYYKTDGMKLNRMVFSVIWKRENEIYIDK